ncbi:MULTISPECIES: class I SAM-dependent methyltransferase [Mesonia]|uniref:Ubiquinone biosynthesis O-methyltransferase n=1 Tax=Mesonia oceanica TaxID=2687242 RepID=A0AC61Y2W1_9FLAO|nr:MULTISPECIES: methyltransferase domain-containing protein [Mesonia]MAN28551.1 transposase [Mesonia sp.]MAQ41233.1 transposase [Mesonia sp.]MBJ97331.1 transposase [Flavobacteriaceae bacterium]VVU98806.1 Ubiquinone biosynthesis O-methyltransferase [Mesonia oceanica]|tara:strand:+ start:39706 stop:40431 length:726 start_codon:yes stop_codon:yes gene_type:complete
MLIDFRNKTAFPGWEQAPQFLSQLITSNNIKNVLEVGSGANPTLDAETIMALGIHYTTNDLSAEELEKAPKEFATWQADLCNEETVKNHSKKYDLIFSRMVNEHVKDGKQYYKNIFELLSPGGITAHCFSTLYAFPFLTNKVIPETLSDKLLDIFNSRDRHQHEKFPAYYSWSRGPSKKSINKFESIGFEVIEYVGYFGHGYYKKRLPFLHYLEQQKANYLVKNPVTSLTSYAHIVLKKSI